MINPGFQLCVVLAWLQEIGDWGVPTLALAYTTSRQPPPKMYLCTQTTPPSPVPQYSAGLVWSFGKLSLASRKTPPQPPPFTQTSPTSPDPDFSVAVHSYKKRKIKHQPHFWPTKLAPITRDLQHFLIRDKTAWMSLKWVYARKIHSIYISHQC